jgi:hypothetical protein
MPTSKWVIGAMAPSIFGSKGIVTITRFYARKAQLSGSTLTARMIFVAICP